MKFKEVDFNDKWPVKLPEFLSVIQVSQYKFWEKERMAAMYAVIREGDVVLDIGTCNGEMSVLFSLWGGKTILVEPSPGFWPNIKAIYDANNQKPFKCYQMLVSNESNIEDLPDINVWPEVAFGEVSPEVGFSHLNEKPNISVIKIDDMKLDHIDVITIDIEGSEYEALQGAEKIIERDKPIIFVSIHAEFMWREHHHSQDDLHVLLGKMGYEGTYLAFDHEQHYMFKPKVEQ